LEASRPESSKISRAYFLWQTEIPAEVLAISKPRKYFKDPKSLRRNFSFNREIKDDTAVGSLLAIAIININQQSNIGRSLKPSEELIIGFGLNKTKIN
jgi:hypothetical protein